MAPVILSNRQRIELENFMLHAPSAKERCRAQALLWLDEGETAEQVAELLHVSRQTVYNWAERFQQREGLDLRARLGRRPAPGPPAHGHGDHRPADRRGHRHRPPRARLSLHGLDRPAAGAST